MLWSDRPVLPKQFTPEQRSLLMRAAGEIWDIYLAAGGKVQQEMEPSEIGLMPANISQWEYQSEQWAAAKAVSAGLAVFRGDEEPDRRRELELAQAYFMVITFIDFVKGGLLDASAIYDDEDDDD